MQILLNGESREVPPDATVEMLLAEIDLGEKRFAVEINEQLVPRSTFAEQGLAEGDRVEIVTAIGGG
ncbi:MAG: sulfur carrier protein ThiS [Sedimenticolaceae bacterium]|nr:sulfur carrier protein ThiS [Sedimenticolaceae bacterium]